LTAFLVSASPSRGIAAILVAMPVTSSASDSLGTTRLTMPSASARSDEILSPRNRNSFANLGPITQGCAKYSTPGMPIRTTGSAKNASSEATIRSQIQASIRPPAMHAPCTCAISGLGSSRQRRHMPR
jgi:hypothetical protein